MATSLQWKWTTRRPELEEIVDVFRKGLKEQDARVVEAAFAALIKPGWGPDHLVNEGIDLRAHGLTLGPILKRVISKVTWEPKFEYLIDWVDYFHKVDPETLSWTGKFVFRRDNQWVIDDMLVDAAHCFARAGALKDLWKTLRLGIKYKPYAEEQLLEVAKLLERTCQKSASPR